MREGFGRGGSREEREKRVFQSEDDKRTSRKGERMRGSGDSATRGRMNASRERSTEGAREEGLERWGAGSFWESQPVR